MVDHDKECSRCKYDRTVCDAYPTLLLGYNCWRHILTFGSVADLEHAIMLGNNVNANVWRDPARRCATPIKLIACHEFDWHALAAPKINLLVQHRADVKATFRDWPQLLDMCSTTSVRELLQQLVRKKFKPSRNARRSSPPASLETSPWR